MNENDESSGRGHDGNVAAQAESDTGTGTSAAPAIEGSLALVAALGSPSTGVEEGTQPARPGRRRRRERRRAKTVSIRRLSKAELLRGKLEYPETGYWKPRTRADCAGAERPCPYVSCKYHLYLDVHPLRGSIKLNFPDLEVWEMSETCALDVADRGGITLEEVGEIMNLTRERVRQVETTALAKLQAIVDVQRLRDYVT
ncbi:MAG: hypothetical protein NZ898_03025 [Myxococcota bacterium]|nr:hypothetical protein [Myxococcota bacterium]MDW8360997.1 sigma factor-like helix-turn-helix DNA-binding protein [Myxococcales bacterium]